MKIKFLKLKNWILVTLLGALGLSSCHSHKQLTKPDEEEMPEMKERNEMRLMYGVPTMNYMIRGQVKDDDGRPVKDIRVNMLERGMEVKDGVLQGDPERVEEWLERSSVATDGEGRFELESSGRPQEEVQLLLRDVDGAANGEYRNRVVDVKLTPADVDRSDANGWNQGTVRKEVELRIDN